MKSTGKLDWNDYWNAWKLQNRHWAPAYTFLWLFIFGVLGLVFFSVYTNSTNRGSIVDYFLWFIPALIVVGILLLLSKWSQRKQLQMAFEQDKRLSAPFDVEISDSELRLASPVGHSNYPWNYFRKWDADDNVIVLYITDTAPVILPRRTIGAPEAVQFLKDKLTQNQVPYAGARKRVSVQAIIVYVLLIIAVLATILYAAPGLIRR